MIDGQEQKEEQQMTDRTGWQKVDLSTYIRLGDDGKTVLVEAADETMGNDDETIESIKGIIQMSVDNRLAEEVATAVDLIEERLIGNLDEFLDQSFTELQEAFSEQLDEAVEGVASMIVNLSDVLSPEARARFYAKAARDADQTGRPDNANHYTSANQDGSHGVSGSDRNKQSLKPDQGITYGTQSIREETEGRTAEGSLPVPYVNHLAKMELAALEKQTICESSDDDREAREALRDHLHAAEQARKDQYHARLMEYIERKEEQSRGVLRG